MFLKLAMITVQRFGTYPFMLVLLIIPFCSGFMFLAQACFFFFLAMLDSVLPLFEHLHPTPFDSLAKALDIKQSGILCVPQLRPKPNYTKLGPYSNFAPNLCAVLNARLYCQLCINQFYHLWCHSTPLPCLIFAKNLWTFPSFCRCIRVFLFTIC